MDVLAIIKGSAEYRQLADTGQDATLAEAINASLPKSTPISPEMLAQAAPQTMAKIATAANPIAEMEVIAARLRAQDWAGVKAWADILLMIGNMPPTEHATVDELVSAATPQSGVTLDQVSNALSIVRHVDEEVSKVRVDGDGNPVLDEEGKQIVDIVQHAGAVRARPIDWSAV